MSDVDKQLLPSRVRLGREELKAEGRPVGSEDVLNVHGGKVSREWSAKKSEPRA
jgi:hypothetical protein